MKKTIFPGSLNLWMKHFHTYSLLVSPVHQGGLQTPLNLQTPGLMPGHLSDSAPWMPQGKGGTENTSSLLSFYMN